ncbi:hypothetical protein J4233_00570 [Candidatus Pacearchaeota archaeon]|nr:hypothetical protein [Candidatus Pacearchaeota archaeon]
MKIIGFNLTKISAERISKETIKKQPSTSIEFLDLKEDKTEFLKDEKIIKLSFKYSVSYGEQESSKEGEVIFQGDVALSVTKEESKNITKDWKKKKLPSPMNIILFNFILRRCTPKAIFLEDEVSLPIHTPMPKLQQKKEE